MTRDDFDRILSEEGMDDARMRDDMWHSRPSGEILESKLRDAAKKFKAALPGLQVRKALHDAMEREFFSK